MWTVNGVDPNTLGLKVSDTPGWETAPDLNFATQQVPGRAGSIVMRPDPQIGPRKITVNAAVVGTSNADMLTKFDAIKALFSSPSLSVIYNNRPARALTCRLDGPITINPGDASMLARQMGIQFALVADDPWWYDTAATNVNGIAAAPGTAMPLGTAPVGPVITATATAGVGALTLTLYNSAGAAIGSITITNGFVLNDVVVIDMAAKTVKLNGVNRLDLLSAGDFFLLDAAAQGSYLTSAWPAIARSASWTVNVSYKKAWR